LVRVLGLVNEKAALLGRRLSLDKEPRLRRVQAPGLLLHRFQPDLGPVELGLKLLERSRDPKTAVETNCYGPTTATNAVSVQLAHHASLAHHVQAVVDL
jgi:hypothetical protein